MTEFVGFDLETTGISSFIDVPVSYGFVQHERRAHETVTISESGFVKPGVVIPSSATAIHGITNEMVANAPVLEIAASTIADRLSVIWSSGGVIVGMNVSYDLTMVDSLCRRLSMPTLGERGVIGPVLDILILDRHFDKWRKGSRKLTDLCSHYGVTLASAHAAVDDAEASLNVLEVMLTLYPAIAELSLERINETLRAWYLEWLVSFSSYLERKGETPISAGRYEWPIHVDT